MEQSSFSQGYPINTEAENYDDPVEFLNEVRVPCLICGADTEIDNIVKQENDQFDEETVNNQEYQLSLNGVSVNHEIFHWFLKWFSVDITKNGKKRLIDRGWDGEGGDILRFCEICKMELKGILEVQKQRDELEEKVKNGLVVVKERMERFEEVFQCNGAYDKDERYKMVRSWILKNETANLGHPTQNRSTLQSSLREPVYNRSKRRSSRINTKANSSATLSNSPACVKTSPTKLAMEKAEKKKIPLPAAKIVRKLIPKTNNIAANDNDDDVPLDKVTTSNKAKKMNKSKPVPYSTKTVKEEVCKPKSARKAKKIVQHTACVQEPAKKTNKLRNTLNSKISEKVTTARETTDIEDDHESSEDHNRDVQRTSKVFCEKYSYELDSLANTITLKDIKFSISGDREKVCCTLCNVSLSNAIGCIRRHFIKHHSSRFACSQCSFRGSCKSLLDTHIKAVHQGTPAINKTPCRICAKPILRPRDHEWTHMSKKEQEKVLQKEPEKVPYWLYRNYKCEVCGKLIPAQKMRDHKLKLHKCIGSENVKEKCPQCGKSFLRLKAHIKYTHGPDKYQCSEQGCGRTFKKLCWLTRHKDFVHKKLRPWKCTKCTRQFFKEFYLKQHMDLHIEKRHWKCEVKRCGAAFTLKRNLRAHQKKIHEDGSKPVRNFFVGGPNKLSGEPKDQKGK